MPQVTNVGPEEPRPRSAQQSVDEIREAFWIVGRSMGQVRLHERLLRAAGVRIDRAGGALLYMLQAHGESVRVTGLADLLGVDAPTVTRKIQQLEREGLVSRHADAEDHRATRIALTESGRRTLERVLKARRAWFDRLLEGWDDRDLAAFAAMLGRFATSLERDLEDARGS
ncbi:MAG: MarR family winged helix-turn-helix transcriptional regulator [Acidimicrobiales bacterium]